MTRRQLRRHAGRVVDFVDDHLAAVWGYLVGMTCDAVWADERARMIIGGVDPRLLDEEGTAAQRLLLARARRAVEDAPPHGPGQGPGRAWLVTGLDDLHLEEREAFVLLEVMGLSVDDAAAISGAAEPELQERRARAHTVVVSHLVGNEL